MIRNPDHGLKSKLPWVAMLAIAAICLLLPQAAFATSAFTFAPDDYFINVILKGVLGDIINPAAGAATTTVTGQGHLGGVFKQFNIGVAFFGSVIVVFITLVGVLQSGNDGEFLGRKWSSMWVPFRFAAGSALMLPLTASGYSYCQAMVLWVASQGIGFADTLWTTIVNEVGIKDGMKLTAQTDIGSVVRQIAISELCKAQLSHMETTAASGVSYGFKLTDSTPALGSSRSIVAKWGNTQTLTDPNVSGACGGIEYSYKTGPNFLTSTSPISDPYLPLRKAVGDVHFDQITKLQAKYENTAKEIIAKFNATTSAAGSDPTSDLVNDLNVFYATTLVDKKAYTDEMAKKITDGLVSLGYKDNTGPAASAMTKYGFAMAGMWYIELVKVHNTARHTLTPPSVISPNFSSLANNPGMENVGTILTSISKQFMSSKSATSSTSVESGSVAAGSGTGSTTTNVKTTVTDFKINIADVIDESWYSSFSSSASNYLREAIFGVGTFSTGASNEVWTAPWNHTSTDPDVSAILQLKDKGDTILNVVGTLMATDMLAKTVVGVDQAAKGDTLAEFLKNVPVVGSFITVAKIPAYIIEKLSGYLMGAAAGLFVFGVALAVYIPMIPYILWVGALIGLTVLILEALVAIMLWAVMLMHPSGEGITSDYNRQGMNMILAVFMRPSLLLMGMILGMFMVEPMIMFINDTFTIVMASVQSNTFTGIFETIAFIAIYVSLCLMVIEKSFAMTHVVPDRVLTWIGGPGALTGEEREVVGKGQQQLQVAGQAMNTIMLGKGMQRMGRNQRTSGPEPAQETKAN